MSKASQIPSPYNQKETEERKNPSKTAPRLRLVTLLFLIPLPVFAFFLPISKEPETQGRLRSETGLAEMKRGGGKTGWIPK